MNASAATLKPSRMSVANVVRGRTEQPIRVLVYGPEGCGKSTFGAGAPDAVFLAPEDGTPHLDVARFPQPEKWADALEAVRGLAVDAHAYKALVVDTVDWLEPMCWQHVIAAANDKEIRSIEDFGYGKGYNKALDEWRIFLAALEPLRRRGMHVILLAHSYTKTFKNPEGEDYDRYQLKVNDKAAGLLKEWVDVVGFARWETYAHKDNKTKRVRGVDTGARLIYTERRAAYDAKNRYNLPETLPLDWDSFFSAVRAGQPADPAVLIVAIAEKSKQLDNATATKVAEAVSRAGANAAELARINDKLNALTQGKE